ncbi:MAG: hypothetical protein V3R85_12560, partial [Alphaproteobacteria bacterium]
MATFDLRQFPVSLNDPFALSGDITNLVINQNSSTLIDISGSISGNNIRVIYRGFGLDLNFITGTITGFDIFLNNNLIFVSNGFSITVNQLLFSSEQQVNEIIFSGNDTILGPGFGTILEGLGGNDTIAAGIGNDTILGGTGNDTLNGGAGADDLNGGAGTDTASYSIATSGVDARLID